MRLEVDDPERAAREAPTASPGGYDVGSVSHARSKAGLDPRSNDLLFFHTGKIRQAPR